MAKKKTKTSKTKKKSAAPARAKPRKAVKARRASRKGGLKVFLEQNYAWVGGVAAVLVILGIWGLARHSSNPTTATTESEMSSTAPELKGFLGKEFAHASKMAMGDRIAYWADYVAQHSAKIERLGKGHKIDDSAPVIPPHFNCTTFVETVASLARSRNAGQFFPNLISIRYRDGKATFGHRNHFPEADWIPNNTKAGLLKDITEEVAESAGVKAGHETKVIDRAAWIASQSEARARGLASNDKYWSKSTRATIPYISVEDLAKVVNKIPNGTVLNLVHRNVASRPVLISHQGYVVREGKQVFFRHATSVGHLRKMDLLQYIARRKREGKSLIGVNLDQFHG